VIRQRAIAQGTSDLAPVLERLYLLRVRPHRWGPSPIAWVEIQCGHFLIV
jgi:hypothetical protein